MEDYRLEQTGQEVQRILNGAAMEANLQAEVERATDAEGTLQGNIDSEERARQDADGLLQQSISDEENRAKRAEEANAGEIEGIKALIPSTASDANKLADTNYVNSSIQTATAEYRGDYNVVTDLHLAIDATHAQIETLLGTVIAEADKNDYCYVMIPTNASTPTEIAKIERYKMTSEGWKFEYDVNNSTFTAEEWAAIKSGITSGLVGKLNALPTNADLLLLLAGKQDVLTFDATPVPESNNPVKSGGVYSAIDDEKTARLNSDTAIHTELDGLQAKVPATASSDNKLVDQNQMNSSISTATATYRGDWNVASDLHLAVDATRAQIAALLPTVISTADNNDYCYVEIPTSAETPTQIESVERYKFNGTAWAFEYVLNNSGFTADQWAAINSMITSGLVAKLTALPTNTDLLAMLAQKQDNLTFDLTPTENSTNPVTSGGVFAADKALSDAIEAILLLIPSAATSLNKLVDTALMNSSISTATATFRGTYNLVSDLSLGIDATEYQIATALALAISTADNNDYAFVQIPTSAETPAQIARTDRYKFNGTAWAFEYTLNTSGFTAAQWAAINSTITSTLVTKLNALPTAAELQEALGTLTSGITAINQKIPSNASQSNKLVDNASMESFIAQVINILDASFNVTSTDGHITLHITQVDGKITAVQVQSSDIASAANLALVTNRVTTAEGNITSLTGRMGTAETNIANLQQLYNNLQQSKPVPVTALPSTGQQQGVIYRLAGTTSYSDYMWNGSSWVLMATYNNAIDDEPTAESDNLVKSGDVFNVSLQSNIVKNILTGKPFSIECVKQFARQCVNTSDLSVGDTFSVDMLEGATNTISLLLDLMISDSIRINNFVVKLRTTASYATYLIMDDNYTILGKGTTSRNGRFTVANTVRYVLFQCNVGESYGIQDGYVEVLPIDSIANSCSNNEKSILDIFESQEKINIPYIEEFTGNLYADGTVSQESSNFYVQKYDVSTFKGIIGCSGQVGSTSINRCGICFYDSNDVFISFLYPSVKDSGFGFHTILDIPVNAKYMRIQGHFNYTKASVFSIKNIIAPKVIREVNEQSIEYGVLQSDGTVSPRTEKNFITKLYDVNTLGNYISLLASYRVTYSNTPIAYYDSNMNCIKTEFTGSGDNADYIHENIAIQLPTGTRYIKLYSNERYYTSHLSKLVNKDDNEEEKILNILAIGNSWSRDSVTELWSVAKDAGITLKVCQAYQGGSSLYNMYKGMDDVNRVYQHGTFNQYTHGTYQLWEYNGNMPQKTPVSSEYNNGKCGVDDGTAWGKNQDGTWAAMTLQECLSMYNWDIILVSCQGTELQSVNSLTTIDDSKGFFDINDFITRMEQELTDAARAKVKWGIMNTWSYPVEMALTYTPTTTMLNALDISDWSALSDAEKQEVYDNMYPNIIKNTQLVANHLADKIHYVCNTATAIQYGRNSEWLKDVAYHMVRSSTDTHLGNGIPKYICGVCIFLSIFNTNKNSILLDYVPDLIDGSGDHSDGGGEANPTTPTRSLCIGSVNMSIAAVNYDYQL